jgi:hypothetical protein
MYDDYRKSQRLIGPVVFFLITLGGPALGQGGELAKEGSFEGNWNLEGTAETVEMEGKEVSVYRVEGPVKITNSSSGMKRHFHSRCVGVSDEKTGGVGRCIWEDEDGEGLFLQLAGTIVGSTGTSRESDGIVVGGTGKYEGIAGAFKVDWLFLESAFEAGKITARDTNFTGSWILP